MEFFDCCCFCLLSETNSDYVTLVGIELLKTRQVLNSDLAEATGRAQEAISFILQPR